MAEKKYQVDFYSTNAVVKAKNEEEAIEKARTLYYGGELSCEIESIKELEE